MNSTRDQWLQMKDKRAHIEGRALSRKSPETRDVRVVGLEFQDPVICIVLVIVLHCMPAADQLTD